MHSRRAWALCESRGLRAHLCSEFSMQPRLPWPADVDQLEASHVMHRSRSWVLKRKRWGLSITEAEDLADALGERPTAWWPEYRYLGDPLELAATA